MGRGIFPSWLGWLAGIATFVAIIEVAAISKMLPSIISETDIVRGLGTIFATFIGAFLAFQFARIQRQQERTTQNVTAGNVALMKLMQIWNAQRQYQLEVVEFYRGRDDAWLNMPATGPLSPWEIRFDLDLLAFLLDSHTRVLQTLMLEEQRFALATRIVDGYSKLQLDVVHPRLIAAGVPMNDGLPRAEIEAALGPSIIRQLQVTSAAILQNIDENVGSSRIAFNSPRTSLIERYPNQRFVRGDFTGNRH